MQLFLILISTVGQVWFRGMQSFLPREIIGNLLSCYWRSTWFIPLWCRLSLFSSVSFATLVYWVLQILGSGEKIIFLLQFLTRELRNKGNQGKCCQKAKAEMMFLGFLYLITFGDCALHGMGVQVDYLSNGSRALYFSKYIIFRKSWIDQKCFAYLDYSLNSDNLQVSVAQDLLLFLMLCFFF